MSDDKPIAPDSPLASVLDSYDVPDLSDGFADRVLAKTKDRPEPLPPLRRGAGRWRTAQRLAVGTLAAGALVTAAAATGALDSLPITLPSAEKVWATITGQEDTSDPTATATGSPSPALVPQTSDPVVIEGPIDTPEELEEAFRRIDEVRGNRQETRRNRVDNRIDRAIERRREQGLPAPTPEQESRLRERIEEFRDRRDNRIDEHLEGRREDLRERVESGEELSREDFIRQQRGTVDRPVRRERLERLRQLPPEERRERLRQFRERRMQRLEQMDGESEIDGQFEPDEAPVDTLPTEDSLPEPEGER
ncbi:MAG: hypothetical protein AAF250_14825 [Pseudomonadota bacterium]